MTEMSDKYSERLNARIESAGSHLCVGIDPRWDQIEGDREDFLNRYVEETAEFAACFKPNIAYFEALGSEGYALLERLLKRIPEEVPVILDAKRGDIGSTQDFYAKAYFEHLGVDAVTLNYGVFIQTVVDFVIIAFAIFMVVRAMNNMKKKEEEKPAAPPAPSEEEVLLTEIRDALQK